ncbi:hypothetical protein [Bacteroides sp. 519]|uniref:hypothetical protein n=1 Tax=Bacteroides sp. 519 TaxID=2302937 RepID=UPI0013D89BFC|nr:hypothetical protein [Bacteroides sp. 519]NDV59396.1 hypothetical protein [Bacteroides sp. 519]
MDTSINFEDNYFSLLKSLKDETKLRLIKKLTDSMLEKKVAINTEVNKDETLQRLAGVWKNDAEAEKIADEIISSRTSGKTRHIIPFDE